MTVLSKTAQYSFKKELLKQISIVLIRGRHFYKEKEAPVPTVFSGVTGKHNVDHLSDVDRAFLQVIYSGKIAAGTHGFTARKTIRDQMLKLIPSLKASVSINSRPSNYNFSKTQKLQNDAGELQAVLYDFMLAKYSPEKLDQKMLEAMLSSRWAYETQEIAPIGGRFFIKALAHRLIFSYKSSPVSLSSGLLPVRKNWQMTLSSTFPFFMPIRQLLPDQPVLSWVSLPMRL